MKISARNQFQGLVTEIITGAVNAEVHLALKGGEILVASITKDSIASLGIKQGLPVIALVKAPQIILVSDFAGYKLSARNQLPGTVTDIKAGQVNTEVDVELSGGEHLAATVTNDSVSSLGISKSKAVTAVFKAGAVILAVPG